MKQKHKEKPLAEITLRKYEKPYRLSGRELVKKLCLSIGLLQPGDTRDVMVDVMASILNSSEPRTFSEIEQLVHESRKSNHLPLTGIAPSNIRRQLRRLKDAFIIENKENTYHVAERAPLHEVFIERIEKLYLPSIVSRVKEYCEAVEKERCSHGTKMSEMSKPNE